MPEEKSLTERESPEKTQLTTEERAYNVLYTKAKLLASSGMAPDKYANNIGACVIAMEMANRTGLSALAVLQNMYVVKGRPSWSGQFVASIINSCGRYTGGLRYVKTGAGDTLACYCWTVDALTNEKIVGETVTMTMARGEGWLGRAGSKWQTMPGLMIQYRAATFFGRVHCPEMLNGMHTREELLDISQEIDPKNIL